ncbi:Glycosyl transferase, family 2 domain protein, partial [mine drainage metagenome]
MEERDWTGALAYWLGRRRRDTRRVLELIRTHGFSYAVRRVWLRIAGRLSGVPARRVRPLARVRVSSPVEGLHFPACTDPEVSIVIPCHAQNELTRACLSAIRQGSGEVPYEVIVVDDASPEPVADRLGPDVRGIRLLRNPT